MQATSRLLSQCAMVGRSEGQAGSAPLVATCIRHFHHRIGIITPRQIAGTNLPTPKVWIAWLARAHVYVHNLLRVVTRLNPAARVGI